MVKVCLQKIFYENIAVVIVKTQMKTGLTLSLSLIACAFIVIYVIKPRKT